MRWSHLLRIDRFLCWARRSLIVWKALRYRMIFAHLFFGEHNGRVPDFQHCFSFRQGNFKHFFVFRSLPLDTSPDAEQPLIISLVLALSQPGSAHWQGSHGMVPYSHTSIPSFESTVYAPVLNLTEYSSQGTQASPYKDLLLDQANSTTSADCLAFTNSRARALDLIDRLV